MVMPNLGAGPARTPRCNPIGLATRLFGNNATAALQIHFTRGWSQGARDSNPADSRSPPEVPVPRGGSVSGGGVSVGRSRGIAGGRGGGHGAVTSGGVVGGRGGRLSGSYTRCDAKRGVRGHGGCKGGARCEGGGLQGGAGGENTEKRRAGGGRSGHGLSGGGGG